MLSIGHPVNLESTRHKAIAACEDGFPIRKVATLYNVSTRSCYRWKMRLKQNPFGGLKSKPRKVKVEPQLHGQLKGAVERFQEKERRTITITEFGKMLRKDFGISFSRSHSHRLLKGLFEMQ
jgi:transposase